MRLILVILSALAVRGLARNVRCVARYDTGVGPRTEAEPNCGTVDDGQTQNILQTLSPNGDPLRSFVSAYGSRELTVTNITLNSDLADAQAGILTLQGYLRNNFGMV